MAKSTLKSWPMLYKKATTGKIQEWEISLNPKGTTVEIVTTYGQRGGKKVTTYETISEGKNEGKANATSVLDQATKEAEAKWKKQQERRHYSLDATGGESADKRGKACMLAKSFEDYQDEVPETGTFALQPKLDGFRCNAHWDAEEKTVTLISREGKVFTTLPHISAAVKAMMLSAKEPSTILDGELWTEELRFSKIASAVKNVNNPPAYAEQVRYHVYDLMSESDFLNRYKRLRDLVSGYDKSGIVLLVSTVFNTHDDMPRSKIIARIKQYEQDCVKSGFEGAMYRNCYHGYENGKRSKNLLKVKSFIDAEFKVTGWKKAKDVVMKGSAGGDIPIFTCVMPDGKEFDVLAPGTVKEKKAFMADIDNWIGKALTVKYFELTDDGVPRFPVAKAFR